MDVTLLYKYNLSHIFIRLKRSNNIKCQDEKYPKILGKYNLS